MFQEMPLYTPKPEQVLTRQIQDGSGNRLLTVQELAWIDAMLDPHSCVPARAAECAGYVDPSAMGWKLKRRIGHLVEAEREARDANSIGTVKELMQLMWSYARGHDAKGNDIPPAVAKASQQDLAKINGMLTEKVDLRLDRSELSRELRALGAEAPRMLAEGLEPVLGADDSD
jgi:hypothetical protein